MGYSCLAVQILISMLLLLKGWKGSFLLSRRLAFRNFSKVDLDSLALSETKLFLLG